MTYMLSLDSIDKVGRFLRCIDKYEGSLDIATGHYSVDAHSLMGILSIDLNRTLELHVPADYSRMESLQYDIQQFLV